MPVLRTATNVKGDQPLQGIPLKQTTAEPITQEQVWSIARKHAKDVMAAIADAQMKTWEKWPPAGGPTDFITEAMVRAIEEAGVKYV